MIRVPKSLSIPLAACILSAASAAASAADASRAPFGALADGTQVESAELKNAAGVAARIITLGAAVQSLLVPDRNGKSEDIVLGYAHAQQYLDKPQY
jgi:aldose 1-epimerase